MMPTLAIMATAVASAPTTTEVRESDAVRLRPASRVSTRRRMRLRVSRLVETTTAGAAMAAAAMASSAAAYPPIGYPPRAGAWAAAKARMANRADQASPRRQRRRAWCSWAPRLMASVGATRMASRAGASADARATTVPVTMPVSASCQVSATGVGRLVV